MNSSLYSNNLLNKSYREHVMLVYKDREECNTAAVNFINEGLRQNYLCIYASVMNGNPLHVNAFSHKIDNYEENVGRENLHIIDFAPFAAAAKNSNLEPFVALKHQIEEMLYRRIAQGGSDRILIYAEAAGSLVEQDCYNESAGLEFWWHKTYREWIDDGLNISLICPHPSKALIDDHLDGLDNHISSLHSIVLDLERQKNKKALNVLVVEPEEDLQSLYLQYFQSIGVNAIVVNDCQKCLDIVVSSGKDFDLIMMDIHVRDASGIEIANKIREIKYEQRIIYTTTSPEYVYGEKNNIVDSKDVLLKPFRLSRLLSVISTQNTK